MSKRAVIVLLAGFNVLLLAALVLTTFSPPTAFGQAAAAAKRGEVMLMSARTDVGTDAVWLVDAGNKQLRVFRPNLPRMGGQPTIVRPVAIRDMTRDFPNNAGAR
jgi:hypothetical protein